MPEHDETTAAELAEEDEFWADVEARRHRLSKTDRWKVEDKVVDGEQK